MTDENILGRRRKFVLTVLDERGSYPDIAVRTRDALFVATPALVYTAVPAEEPNEFGLAEIAWANVGEVRFWGALALSITEGEGFYSFYPLAVRNLFAADLDEDRVRRIAERTAASLSSQTHQLHWVRPSRDEICRLYEALLIADNVLLRGVACYLKSHMFWRHPLFTEEMAINLHISLEAGLSVLRHRLSGAKGGDVSYRAVYEFVSGTFPHGDALVEFWRDRRDDRNVILHPDSNRGAHVMPPLNADDVYELFDPMLSLYRYILIDARRP